MKHRPTCRLFLSQAQTHTHAHTLLLSPIHLLGRSAGSTPPTPESENLCVWLSRREVCSLRLPLKIPLTHSRTPSQSADFFFLKFALLSLFSSLPPQKRSKVSDRLWTARASKSASVGQRRASRAPPTRDSTRAQNKGTSPEVGKTITFELFPWQRHTRPHGEKQQIHVNTEQGDEWKLLNFLRFLSSFVCFDLQNTKLPCWLGCLKDNM